MNERKMTYAEKFAMHIEESCDPPGLSQIAVSRLLSLSLLLLPFFSLKEPHTNVHQVY